MSHFYTPLKTPENHRFSDVFKRYIIVTSDYNRLKLISEVPVFEPYLNYRGINYTYISSITLLSWSPKFNHTQGFWVEGFQKTAFLNGICLGVGQEFGEINALNTLNCFLGRKGVAKKIFPVRKTLGGLLTSWFKVTCLQNTKTLRTFKLNGSFIDNYE